MIGRPLNPWKKGRKKDEFTRDLITMATSNLLTAKRIVILDSLRAIAAGLVVFHHWWVAYPRITTDFVGNVGEFLSNLNYLAVLFFFSLSGFSIGIKYYDFRGIPEVLKYLRKRFRRIVPIAYLALLISFVFSPSKFSPVELFGNLFFLQTPEHLNLWFAPFCGNGPLWSLSYEVWFYLFFPILFCALSAFCANSSSVFALLSWPLGVISLGLNQLSSNPWSQFGSLFPIWVHGWWLAQMKFDRLRTGKTGFPAYIVFAAGLLTIESFLFHPRPCTHGESEFS